MTGTTPDELAIAELETRHANDLLYADRQRMKAGEHEAVAVGLHRRSTLTLWGCAAGAFWLAASGMWFLAAVVVCAALADVRRARQTRETVVQLRRAAGVPGDAASAHENRGPRERLHFAERQLYDAGDFSTVTDNLKKRARTRAIIGMAIATLFAVLAVNNEALDDQIGGLTAFAVIATMCFVDHLRTEQLAAEIEAIPSATSTA